jgi:outer membrane receptor protein involved in Fe transport
VKEAAIEALVPLARDLPFAYELDLSLAYRATDYAVSGFVSTWKVGATWAPIPDLRFRATLSRDIRAPNLSELFQEQDFGLISTFDPLTGTTPTHGRTQSGNPDLQPEKADNFTAGAVFQPDFVPGLSLSVDYWQVRIKDAIQLIQGSQIIDLCYQGRTDLCPRITRNAAGIITTVEQGNFNLATQDASGIDIEGSYSLDLPSPFSDLPSSLSLRVLATHYIENVTNDEITPPNDSVGTFGGAPDWTVTASASYELARFTGTLTARYFTDLVGDNDFIECDSSCPTSTAFARTYDIYGVDGATYLDLALTYDISDWLGGDGGSEVFLNVRNLLNEDPELVPGIGTSGLSYIYSRTNVNQYDTLGRVYRAGVRVEF